MSCSSSHENWHIIGLLEKEGGFKFKHKMTNIDKKQMEECEKESSKRQALAVWKN